MIFEDSIEVIADGVVMTATHGDIESLCDILSRASEACQYAAEDLDYRADFERKHSAGDGEEEQAQEYDDGSESFERTSEQLGKLIEELRERDAQIMAEDNDAEDPNIAG